MRKSGYYIVNMRGGQEYRIKARTYPEAVNKVVEEKKENLHDIIDANSEYVERPKIAKKTPIITDWGYINDMYNEISGGYFHFTKAHKKELYENHNIDSGTDYANYILNIGKIEY